MNATSRLDTLRNMLDMSMREAALGAAIKRAREKKGMTQKDVAGQIPGRGGPIDSQTVSRWERGENTPDLPTLEILAQVLGKPISYFVSEPNDDDDASDDRLDQALAELAAVREQVDQILVLLQEQPAPRRAKS